MPRWSLLVSNRSRSLSFGVQDSGESPSGGAVGFVALQPPEGRCGLFLINTAVTRVKPPEARAALPVPPLHGQVTR